MSNPNTLPETVELPLLPLRDVVVFPHMVIPLFVGRPKSIKALEMAMEGDKHILLVAQKSAAKDDPGIGAGINVVAGTITCQGVADAFGLAYTPLASVLATTPGA